MQEQRAVMMPAVSSGGRVLSVTALGPDCNSPSGRYQVVETIDWPDAMFHLILPLASGLNMSGVSALSAKNAVNSCSAGC